MSDPGIKRKRGRPSKQSKKDSLFSEDKDGIQKIQVTKGVSEPDPFKSYSLRLDLYDELMTDYLSHGVSQQSQLLLRKIAFAADVPPDLDCKGLLKLLNQTTKDLLLNELEVVVWAVFLEHLGWQRGDLSLHLYLLISGFAVKKHMNHDVSHIIPHISQAQPEFEAKFEEWYPMHQDQLSVKPKLLNKRFRELNQPIAIKGENTTIDYNAFVDQILHTSPKSNPLKVIISDEEIMKLYRAYKMNSKILIDSTKQDTHPTLERLDSIVSQFPEAIHANEADPNSVTYVSSSVLDRINSLCSEFLTHESTFNL